jgi:tRNA(Ile)-lysidine synthase
LIYKKNVWLLISEENIVWVLNRRADERFKVTNKTTNILKIELN